uniref:Uncharacterized protein n=1 Tax=Kalanchoe fedtschenkoi TaxID=63787 RepID=A0A7N0V7A4_KALFE
MNKSNKHAVESPSFSSSLLDKVVRSIDEGDESPHPGVGGRSSAARKSQIKGSIYSDRVEIHRSSMERKVKKAGTNRRKFETEAGKKPDKNGTPDCTDSRFTTSIRMDSSRGEIFSALYDRSQFKLQPPAAVIGAKKLKPIRTSTAATRQVRLEKTQSYDYPDFSRMVSDASGLEGCKSSSNPKPEAPSPSSSFQNAKYRAAKIYGELKNVKQPISPGGKLTRFITSLFSKRRSANKSGKAPEHECGAEAPRTQVPVTTCSSASSFYRSCLISKSPASSKRSVRFCPVNIITDDDGRQQQRRSNPRLAPSIRSCSHDHNIKSQQCDLVGENCGSQVQSDLREILKKYQNNGVLNIYDKFRDEGKDGRGIGSGGGGDDEDGASCASSDLFELDHIGGNVNGSINDELPVYGSTQLHSKNPLIW